MGVAFLLLILASATPSVATKSSMGSQGQDAVAGTTPAGTAYRLAVEPRRRLSMRRGAELTIQRRSGSTARTRYRVPVPRRHPEIAISSVVECVPPRETFIFGWLPANASQVVLRSRDGDKLSARVTPWRLRGVRFFVVPGEGVLESLVATVFDAAGREIARRELNLPQGVCAAPGGIDSFFTQYG